MIATEPVGLTNKIERKDVFITIFLALYVLSFYIPNGTFPVVVDSLVLYTFLSVTSIKTIIRQTPLKITSHCIWLVAFGILGLFSSLYARDPSHVYKDLYTLFVAWAVSLSFIQYVQKENSLKRMFFFYAYFPFFLAFYLLINGTALMQGERLGDSLFGNANRIATYLMISLFCISWFIIYSNRRQLIIHVINAIVLLYMIALTGGRKYIIVPVIFFLLLIIFKNWKDNKMGGVLYLILFALAVFFGVWAIDNIPTLYNSIGIRFEGLLSFINGDFVGTDASTVIRNMMISNGWRWFQEKPILGYGLNNFAFMFSQILFNVYAHNNYIEILVDLGLIGFFAYYLFYAYIIVKLIKIKNDTTGLRNFFLSFMLALLIFEIGAVTYQYGPVQIFIGLASAYVWLHENGKIIVVKQSYLPPLNIV